MYAILQISIEYQLGKILQKTNAAPHCLTEGKLDWRKVHPIIWATGGDFNYYRLGERIIPKTEETY